MDSLEISIDPEGRIYLDGVFICRLEPPRTLVFYDRNRLRSSQRGSSEIGIDLAEFVVTIHDKGLDKLSG